MIVEQAEEPLQLEHVAEKIRAALSAPLMVDDQEIYLNASIGLSVYPRDSEDAEQLLSNADTAMYRAKSQGGNGHLFYSPEMTSKSAGRLSLEGELRHALDRDEFVLHYQPTFAAATRTIVGAEALVRWNSRRGMVGPTEFIPIAEETGLIFELGNWVMLNACMQAMQWQQSGLPPLRVAVNLSARQFMQSNLLDTISGALRRTGLAPELLALEITESMLMYQHESIAETLSRLSSLGIRIAIDDFGTGYSSLAYLKRFRVQELKIDRSFVRGVPDNADDAAIVTAIVSMAKSLGLRLIAEGVETEAQLQFLQELGCDTVQGFLLGKPEAPRSSSSDSCGRTTHLANANPTRRKAGLDGACKGERTSKASRQAGAFGSRVFARYSSAAALSCTFIGVPSGGLQGSPLGRVPGSIRGRTEPPSRRRELQVHPDPGIPHRLAGRSSSTPVWSVLELRLSPGTVALFQLHRCCTHASASVCDL